MALTVGLQHTLETGKRGLLAAAVISNKRRGWARGGRIGASGLVVDKDGLGGEGQEGGAAGALRTKPHERLVYQIDSREYGTFATNAAHEGPRAECACYERRRVTTAR
jgi:hypothetical protein